VITSSSWTTGSVTIAPVRRTAVRQKFGPTAPVTVTGLVTVGATVPETIELQSVPETILSYNPAVKGYRYFV
jgi:hypothetical protein